MTTASWSTRVRHDSDATWQEWRDEFITKLGLMVTGGLLAADETNITPGAGARPGTNTEGGYAVYHLNDSLHGTAPVYIRFGFGTHSGATGPRIQVTTGTSTNGSGVLGGTALSAIRSITGNAAQTSDTARQSYMSNVAGFLGVSWKVGAGVTEAGFFICRTCDADGAITETGSMVHWCDSGGSSARQSFRYAATASAGTLRSSAGDGAINIALGVLPMSPTSSAVGSDVQAIVGWVATPRMTPLFAVCGVFASELSVGGTFSTTLVGSSPHTYLTLPANFGTFAPMTNALVCAMIWE